MGRLITTVAVIAVIILNSLSFASAETTLPMNTSSMAEKLNPATASAPAAIPAGPNTQAPQVSRGESLARSILGEAVGLLGTPYHYGGRSVKGFDCSGFVGYVFGMCNIKLPRSSREQSSIGSHVEKKDLIPADLVFFKTGGSSRINHVGIYVGDSRFIHASTSRGITYNSLNDTYYRYSYYGARRVIEY